LIDLLVIKLIYILAFLASSDKIQALISAINNHSSQCSHTPNFSISTSNFASTTAKYKFSCSCNYVIEWCSSPSIGNSITVLSQRLIIATIVNGDGYHAYAQLCTIMNMKPVSSITFIRFQEKFLSVIEKLEKKSMKTALLQHKDKELDIIVDFAWSHRRNAEEGSFIVISCHNDKIIASEHIQRCPLTNSPNHNESECERDECNSRNFHGASKSFEGQAAKRVFTRLKEAGYKVKVLIHDKDSSTSSHLHTIFPDSEESFDLGHYKKRITTMLDSLSEIYEDLAGFATKLAAHFKHAAANSTTSEQFNSTLDSFIPHVTGNHEKCNDKCKYKTSNATQSVVLNESDHSEELVQLRTIIELIKKDSHKLLGAPSSNVVESVNRMRLKYCDKVRSWRASYAGRSAMSVLDKNEGSLIWLLQVFNDLNMPVESELQQSILHEHSKHNVSKQKQKSPLVKHKKYKSKQVKVFRGSASGKGERYKHNCKCTANTPCNSIRCGCVSSLLPCNESCGCFASGKCANNEQLRSRVTDKVKNKPEKVKKSKSKVTDTVPSSTTNEFDSIIHSVEKWSEIDTVGYDILLLDTETTGLQPDSDIVEIAFIDLINLQLHQYLIRPPGFISFDMSIASKNAQKKHKIQSSWVLLAKPEHEVINSIFQNRSKPIIIIAHNVQFDKRFLTKSLNRCKVVPTIHFIEFQHVLGKTSKLQSLESISSEKNLTFNNAHRAAGDCIQMLKIIINSMKKQADIIAACQSSVKSSNGKKRKESEVMGSRKTQVTERCSYCNERSNEKLVQCSDCLSIVHQIADCSMQDGNEHYCLNCVKMD